MEKSELWPADNSAVTSHLSMLQGIISRLASNSASCKTWCLALVGALLSFAGATDSPRLATLALLPILVFCLLDAMYLAQERAYRGLYNAIVAHVRAETYSRDHLFEAEATFGTRDFLSALRSWSILPLYLGLLLGYAVAAASGWLVLAPVAPGAVC